MRNKRPLLLALPVLLGVAVWGTREASWRKQEHQFHLAMHEWLRYEAAGTWVYPSSLRPYGESQIYFEDESADSLLAIDQMKLIPSSSPRPQNKSLLFISMTTGGSVGEPWGFYLSESEDRGWIEIAESEMYRVDWKNYELSPETCHALKQRIYALQKKLSSRNN